MKNIGKKIKERRIELGLTASELADRIQKDRATIYRYENGDIENLPTTILEPLAKALHTTPGYLTGWESNNSTDNDKHSDTYGDHEANLNHFKDNPELLSFYKEMVESDNLKLLFDTGRQLTPEELEKVLKYMKMVMDGDL